MMTGSLAVADVLIDNEQVRSPDTGLARNRKLADAAMRRTTSSLPRQIATCGWRLMTKPRPLSLRRARVTFAGRVCGITSSTTAMAPWSLLSES
ncbi:MAG: hypothetical protein OXD29_04790 [Roseovarius sp.]|nr:hypothetical protein [Roseovarius sp.]MCY4207253.1 hypothetical protein [Roseovarius sp.]MCY4291361.1 hypothetical protein [Roseovarius sp.]MCY4315892.1 hypothetical protein [Roseovarius sp.]